MARIGIISFYNLDILDNGGKIRSYNIAKELSNYHKVFLIMPNSKNAKKFNLANFEILRLNLQNKSYFRKYLTFIKMGLKFFKEKKINLLICESLWTLPIGISISKLLKLPLILNEQNLEFLRSIQLKNYIRFFYSLFLEFILIQFCNSVIFVSRQEKEIMKKVLKNNIKSYLLPNGTPTIPSNSELEKKDLYKKQIFDEYGIKGNKFLSIFIGDLSYSPNIHAINKLDQIAQKYQDSLKIFVIGKKTNNFMKIKYKNVIFTGFVKNINKYLYGADFTIIPIESGGGTNLKIYEALAVGLPIITTKYAIKNVEINNESKILIADEDYEERVETLMQTLNTNSYKRRIDNSYNWKDYVKNFLNELNLN